jgi:GNAT superfamily N-acetyltransferase
MKLSTFYIARPYRGLGLGPALLGAALLSWRSAGILEAHVTADETRAQELEELLLRFGFVRVAELPGRYRPDHVEVVFSWLPEEQ